MSIPSTHIYLALIPNPRYLYGQSKLTNILVSNHFAAKYTTLMSTVLHPGGIRTGLRRCVHLFHVSLTCRIFTDHDVRYGSGIMHTIKDKLLYPPSCVPSQYTFLDAQIEETPTLGRGDRARIRNQRPSEYCDQQNSTTVQLGCL